MVSGCAIFKEKAKYAIEESAEEVLAKYLKKLHEGRERTPPKLK
jgi:hypothetical protein